MNVVSLNSRPRRSPKAAMRGHFKSGQMEGQPDNNIYSPTEVGAARINITSGGFGVTETPFAVAPPGNGSDNPADIGERQRFGQLCSLNIANSGGFSQCRSCRLGGLGTTAGLLQGTSPTGVVYGATHKHYLSGPLVRQSAQGALGGFQIALRVKRPDAAVAAVGQKLTCTQGGRRFATGAHSG